MYRIAGDGDDLAHQGRGLADCHVNRNNRIHIVYDTARVCGKHRGIDLSSCNRVDNRPLSALRILGKQRTYSDTRLILYKLLQLLNRLRLVVLHCDYALCMVKELKNHL